MTQPTIPFLPFARRGVRLGMSARATLRAYRAAGGRIGNVRGFAIFRQAREEFLAGDYLRRVPRRQLLTRFHTIPARYTMKRHYSISFDVEYVTPEGETKRQTFSLSRDRLDITREEAEEEMRGVLEEELPAYGMQEVRSVTATQIKRQAYRS